MLAHRHSRVVREAWPVLILVGLIAYVAYRYVGPLWSVPFVLLDVILYFLYRDPWRDVPAEPLAVISPVDGKVIGLETETDNVLAGEWQRIVISASRMGAYTVRSPIEASVCDAAEHPAARPDARPRGMWLRSEDDHDVILMFPGRYPGLGPKAFVRYGERVGQGERFAYLRLAPRAELLLPASAQMRIAKGDRVRAGETVLGDLPEAQSVGRTDEQAGETA